jgi:6,7-dimethyl-8-ribityllumazine synthase
MDANVFGKIDGNGMRFGIVRARFNEEITGSLLASCRRTLAAAGVAEKNVHVAEVPGSFEIPYAVQEFGKRGKYSALIALGCIIKGGTPHFELISTTVHDSIGRLSLELRIPVIAGILTCLTPEQAHERAGDGPLNRGVEAAHAALEMAHLRQKKGWKG